MFRFREVYIEKGVMQGLEKKYRPICVPELFGNVFEKYCLKPLEGKIKLNS